MTASRKLQTAEQWTRFWESGSITTFVGRFEDNYDGELREFWHAEFGELPHDARIVDLGTGNGALVRLAAEYSVISNRQFLVTGVDYADIDPSRWAKKSGLENASGVRFLGGTHIEHTGLDSGTFDSAVSQFGFEYADPDRAVRELDRVLKPQGARVAFIMHYDSSDILAQARDGLAQVAACESSQLHKHIKPLLRRLRTLKKNRKDPARDKEAERLRAVLNDVTGAMHERQNTFEDPSVYPAFLRNSMAVFNPRQVGGRSFRDKLTHLKDVDLFVVDYKQRMEDLTGAALSEDALESLKGGLQSHGFAVEQFEPFRFGETKFGYVVRAVR